MVKMAMRDQNLSLLGDMIYLVPHTHYDAIWVFSKEDYFYINTELIMTQAVDIIKKTTDYKFTIEQTFLLEYIEANYPNLFSDIVNFVKQKRIEIAGGQYLQSDTMIPHGEVLIREIARGKKFIMERFGIKDITVAWGADEFGFNAQCPQIFTQCGYKYFAFRRGVDRSSPSEFLWQGLDGSTILSHWMPLGYRAGLDLSDLDNSYVKLKKCATTNLILMPSGSGVTLPQLETSKAVEQWNTKGPNRDKARLIISTPSEYFDALNDHLIKSNALGKGHIKVFKGELYSGKLSEVFPDCTSSRMWIKQGAKQLENSVLVLERWNAICRYVTKNPDHSDQLQKYWQDMLFVAMHDCLPGTGIDEVYKEIREVFNNVNDTVYKSIFESVRSLASLVFNYKLANHSPKKENENIKSTVVNNLANTSVTVTIFNSLPFTVKDWVECELQFGNNIIQGIKWLRACDSGELIRVEVIDYKLHEDKKYIQKIKIGFVPTVPALGIRVFDVIYDESLELEVKEIKETSFTSKCFKIDVNPENGTISISKNGKKFLAGNELRLEEELGDLYYHRENIGLMKSESGGGIKYGTFRSEHYGATRGNLRTVINIKSKYYALRWPYRLVEKLEPVFFKYDHIDIEKKIIIYNDIDRIDFETKIHDRHPHSRLRVKFDLKTTSKKLSHYWCGCPFGAIKRKTNLYYDGIDNKKIPLSKKQKWVEKPSGTFPSLEWFDLSESTDGGATVIHRGLPSHEVRDNSIYLTLLRSVVLLSSDGVMGPCIPTPDAAEKVPYIFSYAILPHERGWQHCNSHRQASQFNMPLLALQTEGFSKISGKPYPSLQPESSNSSGSHSFLEISPANIVLSTIKLADEKSSDSVKIIIRIFETKGIKTNNVRLKFDREINSAFFTDMLEREISPVERNGADSYSSHNPDPFSLVANINPYQILSIKITFK